MKKISPKKLILLISALVVLVVGTIFWLLYKEKIKISADALSSQIDQLYPQSQYLRLTSRDVAKGRIDCTQTHLFLARPSQITRSEQITLPLYGAVYYPANCSSSQTRAGDVTLQFENANISNTLTSYKAHFPARGELNYLIPGDFKTSGFAKLSDGSYIYRFLANDRFSLTPRETTIKGKVIFEFGPQNRSEGKFELSSGSTPQPPTTPTDPERETITSVLLDSFNKALKEADPSISTSWRKEDFEFSELKKQGDYASITFQPKYTLVDWEINPNITQRRQERGDGGTAIFKKEGGVWKLIYEGQEVYPSDIPPEVPQGLLKELGLPGF